ncbi:GNAT family N-acetyltransferase [Smaragdicoccus niigatensis]|uniref:GNAT family N-acetyltransferase n=1 Tax=Smaragdicoccus niigatensis TaxID=359359 RepID=UPI0003707804|nr:GNAT family N-acetyltransferase [Smaragdicoccus niigatensis]
MSIRVRQLTSTDVPKAAEVFAAAFDDDPVGRWLVPRGTLVPHFRSDIDHWHAAPGCADVAIRDGEIVGAALWDPPGYEVRGLDRILGAVASLRALRGGIVRGSRAQNFLEAQRPEGSYCHLALVGAAVKGQGIGSALLANRVDRLDSPIYLESSNIANVPLYERFGFQVLREATLPGGPTWWLMYRS